MMVRTSKPLSTILENNSIRTQARRNAMAHNTVLTEKYLCTLNDYELVNNVHPTDRTSYSTKLGLSKSSE